MTPDYLRRDARGLAGGDPWFCDYGPELSRGFRALKVWFTLKEHGAPRLGAAIERNCDQARYLAAQIAETDGLELMAPVALNIVCFRFRRRRPLSCGARPAERGHRRRPAGVRRRRAVDHQP